MDFLKKNNKLEFHDIKYNKYCNEPLNGLSSLVYLLLIPLLYNTITNKYISIPSLSLAFGSLLMHCHQSPFGQYMDRISMNLILFALLSQSISKKQLILLIALSILLNSNKTLFVCLIHIILLNLLSGITKNKLINFIGFMILAYISFNHEDVKINNNLIVYYFIQLLMFIIFYNNNNQYNWKYILFLIILFIIACKFQRLSYLTNKTNSKYKIYYHSLWHILTMINIYLLSRLFN